jgi:hypothetical protein
MTSFINLDINKIKEIDLDRYKLDMKDMEFFGDCGRQHYRLLMYLSNQFNDVDIFDIGTHRGSSALALSHNKNNRVYSFDIENRPKNYKNKPENVEFVQYDLFDFSNNSISLWKDKILKSPLIFLDIDPHDGILEYNFYQFLLENNYKGLLILDDINYFEGMRIMWSKINTNKLDLTKLGHWSGTGLVNISNKITIDYNDNNDNNNYTIVTAYFDLTKCPDASKEIKERDGTYYLKYANGCLNLNYNMVIFCDPEYESSIWDKRPKNLHYRTKVIPISFEDMKMTKYRQKIIQNRIDHPYHFDNRNTASYYLLCMARYDALKRIIEENPFNSTHFGWINICIERMGAKNLENLDLALSQYRDKFSTCYIDYIPPHFTLYLKDYYQYGRCSMCSGFFTGNKKHMYEFCNMMEEAFVNTLEKGYGHADEQLFLMVYYKKPELFDLYYGDYQQMITNYTYTHENPEITCHLLIPKAFNDNNFEVCFNACKFIWNSYILNYIYYIPNFNDFLMYFFVSSLRTNPENHKFFIDNIKGNIYDEFVKKIKISY